MKRLIALLLLATQAFAGLPPTNLNTQNNTSLRAHSNIVAPYSQFTDLGGINGLLETGNKNLLANPGFENITATTSWTTTKNSGTTFVSAADGVSYTDGGQSLKQTATAATGCISQDISSLHPDFSSVNMEYGAWVKTSATDVQVCARQAGATVGTCTSVPSTNTWVYVPVNYPGVASGTTLGVSVCNTVSGTETFNVDDAYVGKPRNLGVATVMTDWNNSLAFTFNGFGTVTNTSMWTRRVGDTLEVQGYFQVGTTAASTASIQLPSGYAIDTTKFGAASNNQMVGIATNASGGAGVGPFVQGEGWVLFYDGSTTNQLFWGNAGVTSTSAYAKLNGNAVTGNNYQYSVHFSVPIAGWSSYSAFVAADQADYGWRDNTANYSFSAGFGTTTGGSVFEKRTGDTLYVRGYFKAGTVAASAGYIQIPYTIDSTKFVSTANVQRVGIAQDLIASGSAGNTFAQSPSDLFYDGSTTNQVFFGQQVQSSTYTKRNVSLWANTNDAFTFNFSVPISGWNNSNRAPSLLGSVTSAGSLTYHTETVAYESVCSSGTCSVTRESSNWITTTFNSTGAYNISFTAGEFSAAPICVASGVNESGPQSYCRVNTGATSTTATMSCSNPSGTVNAGFNIWCMGPH